MYGHEQRSVKRPAALVVATVIAVVLSSDTAAQKRPRKAHKVQRAASTTHQPRSGDVVTINYPDSVDLASFVDYVSQSLDLKIIYGDEVNN